LLGDLVGQFDIRRWGGFLNETAILLFLGITIYSIVGMRSQTVKRSASG
jgi:hypothetical protein